MRSWGDFAISNEYKEHENSIGSKGHNPGSLEQRNRMKVYIYNGVFLWRSDKDDKNGLMMSVT